MFVGNVAILSAAANAGDRVFDLGHFLVCKGSNFLANGFFSRETEIWCDFRVFDDGLGIAFAARIATTAAVCLGEHFEDFVDERVGFDFKSVGSQRESDAKE